MNPTPAASCKKRPSTIAGLTSSIALLAAVTLTACSAQSSGSPITRGTDPHWLKGAGSKEVSTAMKIDVPSGASEVKGAVRVNPREDDYLLSFITTQDTAEKIARDLNPDKPLGPARKGRSTKDLFGHVGLAAPESLERVQWAGVCPLCTDSTRSSLQWIEIYVAPLPDHRARVYLQAF